MLKKILTTSTIFTSIKKTCFWPFNKVNDREKNELPKIEPHMNGAVKKIVSNTVIGFVRNTQSSGD